MPQLSEQKKQRAYQRCATLPVAIKSFAVQGCWLIGGAVRYMLGDTDELPRDWDIVCPFYLWANVAVTLPKNAAANSFGGLKFVSDGVEIDIWPGEIENVLIRNMHDGFLPKAINLRYRVVLDLSRLY